MEVPLAQSYARRVPRLGDVIDRRDLTDRFEIVDRMARDVLAERRVTGAMRVDLAEYGWSPVQVREYGRAAHDLAASPRFASRDVTDRLADREAYPHALCAVRPASMVGILADRREHTFKRERKQVGGHEDDLVIGAERVEEVAHLGEPAHRDVLQTFIADCVACDDLAKIDVGASQQIEGDLEHEPLVVGKLFGAYAQWVSDRHDESPGSLGDENVSEIVAPSKATDRERSPSTGDMVAMLDDIGGAA